jgi:hypothetical protein
MLTGTHRVKAAAYAGKFHYAGALGHLAEVSGRSRNKIDERRS